MSEVVYIDEQVEKNACVPIAVINALRWFTKDSHWGFNAMRETFKTLGWNPKSGCHDPEISGMLRHFDIPYVYVPNADLETIERWLSTGQPLLLSYIWQRPEMRPRRKMSAHLVFVEYNDGPLLKIRNVAGNGAESKVLLQKYLSYGGASLWLLG